MKVPRIVTPKAVALLLAALVACVPFVLAEADSEPSPIVASIPASADLLRPKAEQGVAESQFLLAYALITGLRIPEDDAEGVKWLRKAIAPHADGHELSANELGSAQTILGAAYLTGTGVPKDIAEAVNWFRKAFVQNGL